MLGVYLIAGSAARFQPLGVVPAAVDLSILVEVNEVHQELIAHAAHKAGRVPTHTMTRTGCKYSNVTTIYLASTLKMKKKENMFKNYHYFHYFFNYFIPTYSNA